jgi:hypothetical protein
MVIYACDPSTWEVSVADLLGPQSETLSQEKERKLNTVAILFLDIYPKETNACPHEDLCTNVTATVFQLAPKIETTQITISVGKQMWPVL